MPFSLQAAQVAHGTSESMRRYNTEKAMRPISFVASRSLLRCHCPLALECHHLGLFLLFFCFSLIVRWQVLVRHAGFLLFLHLLLFLLFADLRPRCKAGGHSAVSKAAPSKMRRPCTGKSGLYQRASTVAAIRANLQHINGGAVEIDASFHKAWNRNRNRFND